MRSRILVVDDEPNMCRSLAILLAEEGRVIATARSGEEALLSLDADTQVVLCDLSMPGMDGLEVLRRISERAPEVKVILMTAYSTVPSAVEAMRLGAFEYLIKPFTDEEVSTAVDGALQAARPRSRARSLPPREPDRLCELIGRSLPMQRLFSLVERAAESDATVLITGESGTGKELVARAIHTLSRRRDRPFVAVNCAALSEHLLESELFGHERGAFTGAHKLKVGRLEQASGGTIFLDEVAEMSPALQTKLLRALAEHAFERVGGVATLSVDLRVVAATNRDLSRRIADGAFREDLFYRLNVVRMELAPLRERPGDLPLLADLFLREKAAELGVPPRRLSDGALAALSAYDFPGNVRELENLIERAMVLGGGELITADELPLEPAMRTAPPIEALIGGSLENGWARLQVLEKALERQLLERAIAAFGERPNEEIARRLGTSRRILELRLQEFEIQKKR